MNTRQFTEMRSETAHSACRRKAFLFVMQMRGTLTHLAQGQSKNGEQKQTKVYIYTLKKGGKQLMAASSDLGFNHTHSTRSKQICTAIFYAEIPALKSHISVRDFHFTSRVESETDGSPSLPLFVLLPLSLQWDYLLSLFLPLPLSLSLSFYLFFSLCAVYVLSRPVT